MPTEFREISRWADQMASYTLDEENHSLAVDRTDSKFFFHINDLSRILEMLSSFVKVLDVEGHRVHDYISRYFDTDDFLFYRHHHDLHKNRYKFRFRNYVSNSTTFFEVKKRTNRNRTEKSRLRRPSDNLVLDSETETFVADVSGLKSVELLLALDVFYRRISLSDPATGDRMTIDFNLELTREGKTIKFEYLVIVEIKQGVLNKRTRMFQVLADTGHLERRISKYCLGIMTLVDGIKTNLFKQRLREVEKIEREDNRALAS